MRRSIGIAAFSLSVAALIAALVLGRPARAVQLQQGSPTAGTPAATTENVTLVAWYEPNASGNVLDLRPIQTGNDLVAGPGGAASNAPKGTADFESKNNDSLPEIKLNESVFDAYAFNPDDPTTVQRTLYYNDEQGSRPATIVMQVKASKGPYKGYDGTATFVSRASNAGGVLVIVLKPPA